jgi:hypothetical protein
VAIWNILKAIWYILWPFGNLVTISYHFPHFGILCQEKSGNHVELIFASSSGANRTIVSYNASAEKACNTTIRPVRFENKFFFCIVKSTCRCTTTQVL